MRDVSSPTVILRACDLRKRFDGLVAVDDVSFEVESGTVHALIGPNGAGKTTVFNLLTGLATADSGTVEFEGEEITKLKRWQIAGRGLARSFQHATLFWTISAGSNVRLASAAAEHGLSRPLGGLSANSARRADEVLHAIGLGSSAADPAQALSHGDQRTLEIATALALDARLLLLDEPTSGMSAGETRSMTDLIRHVAERERRTILFIEHDMNIVFDLADRVTVLDRGRVLADGAPAEIRRSRAVQEAYLGSD